MIYCNEWHFATGQPAAPGSPVPLPPTDKEIDYVSFGVASGWTLVSQVGGWQGESEPSYCLRIFSPRIPQSVVKGVSKRICDLYNQKAAYFLCYPVEAELHERDEL